MVKRSRRIRRAGNIDDVNVIQKEKDTKLSVSPRASCRTVQQTGTGSIFADHRVRKIPTCESSPVFQGQTASHFFAGHNFESVEQSQGIKGRRVMC